MLRVLFIVCLAGLPFANITAGATEKAMVKDSCSFIKRNLQAGTKLTKCYKYKPMKTTQYGNYVGAWVVWINMVAVDAKGMYGTRFACIVDGRTAVPIAKKCEPKVRLDSLGRECSRRLNNCNY